LIFTITLEYQGEQYTYQHEITSSERQKAENWTDEVLAEYLYEEGNYACDCNRSDFIAEHCDKNFPELECGDTVNLISLEPRPVYPERNVYVQQAIGLYVPIKMQGEYSQ
jgi:hypothetical protein